MTFTPFIGPIVDVIRRVIPDKEEQARLENELQAAAMESDARLAEAQSRVIVAEAEGNWLQKSWRPVLMFLLMAVLVWHMMFLPFIAYALGAQLTDMVGLAVVPETVWTLLIVGMGGYIGGRTLEKVMRKN